MSNDEIRSDLGGIESYTNAFGGNATSWYTDKRSQKVYKDYIKLLVNRYKCSSAIFAWELGNEPRCNGCPTSVIYSKILMGRKLINV